MLAALNEAVRFARRPAQKADLVSLFNQSLLVQGRSSIAPDDADGCTWRHGWLYDVCAYLDPNIADKSKNHVKGVPPQPDGPVVKMFFEAVFSIMQAPDVVIAPNARSLGASRTLLNLTSKAPCTDVLNIIYKEYTSKGKTKLHEVVHLAMTKPFGVQPARAR